MTKFFAALATCLAVLPLIGCGTERAPRGITCEKLRALRVGMSVEEVGLLLGAPDEETRQDGRTVFDGPDGTDLQWAWPGSVRLYLSFGDGRLLGVRSWVRTVWRDLFDNESRPTLFTLEPSGRAQEGELFDRVFCP